MAKNTVAKNLEFAFNHYDHLGEFDFYGNKIVVFRRCGYEDYQNMGKDGKPKYFEGDEAVAAFVNDEFMTGWYEQASDDLEYAMDEAVEWIFDNKQIEIEYKVHGTVGEDALKARCGIKRSITQGMMKIIEEMCGEKFVPTLKIFEVEKDNYGAAKFTATFKGGKNPFEIIRGKSWLDFHNYTDNTCIEDGEIEFANEADQELYESMFTYKQEWL